MAIQRRYKTHFLANVFRANNKAFEFIFNSVTLAPKLLVDDEVELRQLCALHAENQEGQKAGTVDPNLIKIISITQVESKEVA